MAVLMEHELRVAEERSRPASEIDPPPARRGVITGMQTGEQRMLDHAHVIHSLPEHGFERRKYRRRDRD